VNVTHAPPELDIDSSPEAKKLLATIIKGLEMDLRGIPTSVLQEMLDEDNIRYDKKKNQKAYLIKLLAQAQIEHIQPQQLTSLERARSVL